jgi:hypothetical protein
MAVNKDLEAVGFDFGDGDDVVSLLLPLGLVQEGPRQPSRGGYDEGDNDRL